MTQQCTAGEILPPTALDRQPDGRLAALRTLLILAVYAVLAGVALWADGFGGYGLLLIPPALLGGAFILSGFLNAGHDCVHSAQYPWRGANRIVGAAWCAPILINFTIYKRQHLVHHRFTGIPGDSEGRHTYRGPADYWIAQLGWHYWIAVGRRIVLTLRGDFPASLNSPALRRAARLDNAAILLWLAGCMLLSLWFPREMLLAYWLPLLAYPAFAMFFSLPEHYALTEPEFPWPRSRNVRSKPLVRFFQWNANYHAFHHRAPSVPAVKLGAASVQADFLNDPMELSYFGFHSRIIAGIKQRHPE